MAREYMARQAGGLHRGVAKEIRVILLRKDMHAQALAQRIGMSQSAMSRRMVGELPFTLDDLEAIAAALDVPITDLLGDLVRRDGGRKDTWAYDRPGHVPVAIATVPTVPLPRGALATPPASPTRTARTGR